jgi:hypothetical protein
MMMDRSVRFASFQHTHTQNSTLYNLYANTRSTLFYNIRDTMFDIFSRGLGTGSETMDDLLRFNQELNGIGTGSRPKLRAVSRNSENLVKRF